MFIAFASLVIIIIALLLLKRGFSSDPDRKGRIRVVERFIPFPLIFLGIFPRNCLLQPCGNSWLLKLNKTYQKNVMHRKNGSRLNANGLRPTSRTLWSGPRSRNRRSCS